MDFVFLLMLTLLTVGSLLGIFVRGNDSGLTSWILGFLSMLKLRTPSVLLAYISGYLLMLTLLTVTSLLGFCVRGNANTTPGVTLLDFGFLFIASTTPSALLAYISSYL